MIGRLRGVLAEVGDAEALVDVGGVGYLVQCGARTLSRLPVIGDEVLLHIDSQTREDGTRLYGFLSREDRRAFVALQSVQGVGPKAALAVLDVLSPGELATAVAREDKAAVGRAQGVGPKLAQRIVVELKDKPLAEPTFGVQPFAPFPDVAEPAPPSVSGEAVSALMGLGIAEPAARRAVDAALARHGEDADISTVIKDALREIGR
jgi:Holliday junction DNA helicase RuvA